MSKFVTLHGFGGGSSGTELNFEIVGGTTEPSNPTENMIWINTDTPITSWEFSATEPNSFREIELSCVSNNQWYLTCSQSLSVGNVLYFEIPASVTNTYEAINIIDPVTGNEYFIRNNDGSACTTWVKGTKICVILSDDTNGLNGYGSTGKTAYIINDNSYGVAKGKVWICVGTSSSVEFNLLKENTAKIYPIFAKQYIGGAWVDKTAKSYQGGEWVEWVTNQYLFKAGEGAKVEFANNSESNSIINITNGYIEITSKASSGARAVITTKDKISTAGKSSLVAEVILTGLLNSPYPFALCLTNKPYAVGVYDIAAYTELKTTGSHVQTVQVPLDTLSGGEYYIAITGAVNAKIINWYMR